MLKSKFPLSRSLRNDTGLVTKRLDAKTFLRANRQNPGRFGPGSFRPGRFGLGRFGHFLRWVVPA